jgi:hypothetical protein
MNPAAHPDREKMLKRIHDNFKTAAGAMRKVRSENSIALHKRLSCTNPTLIIKELNFEFA